MGKRSFDELSVVATGVQSVEDRFGKLRRHEYDDLPTISQWRSNLTGLSQEHNLYFVAYGSDIHVYVPQFPTQAVSRQPTLIVPSQASRPGLAGYLAPQEPHSINNLVVQHLGNDEVIATVRDDGDVEMILVRHVLQAVERRGEPGTSLGTVADEMRPIFQSNVGISAWGLAIHTEARILATSSNAHSVQVFKFGLLQDEEPPDAGEGDELHDATLSNDGSHRKMDVIQRVLNGDANIPCIAFCNTGDDPEARWLLTTDISGYCRAMDLHRSTESSPTAQQFRFGRSFLGHGGNFDRLNAGWAIIFLDRRSFHPAASFHDAVGIAEDESLPGGGAHGRVWDLSDTVESVPNNSPAFTYNDPKARRGSRRQQRQRSNGTSQESTPSRTPSVQPASDHQTQQDTIEIMVEQLVTQAAEDLVEDNLTSPNPSSEPDADLTDHETYEDPTISLVSDSFDPSDEGTEDSIPYNAMYGGKRVFANHPYFYHQNSLCEDLPCPILHASVKNIYLLQPSNQRHQPGPFAQPMVGIANPLRQAVQHQFSYLNMFDRLNMNAYIPALGVVVVASQKGRAVVLSLSKLAASARYPDEVRRSLGRAKTNYAMRVECVLPYAHQELKNQRPFAPLHGIAVGPIQGTEGLRDERKRFRLMMMYQDHSVFSYEISRRRARDSGIGSETLVV